MDSASRPAPSRHSEMEDVSGKEICAMLSISESNLWVMLHCARMALRECLETNWFGKMNPHGTTDARLARPVTRRQSVAGVVSHASRSVS